MRRTAFLLVFVLSAFVYAATDTAHSRFSGTWRMDPARSESVHQDVPLGLSTVVIQITGTRLTIETTRDGSGKSPEFHEVLTFNTDGSETTSTGNAGVTVTGRARWVGPKLVVETVRNVQDSTVTTVYIHTLSPNGRDMTIDKTLTVQHGYMGQSATNTGKGKDVYVRVSK